MRKLFFIYLVLGLNLSANASRLGNAFQALEIYNYFQAKKLFEKLENKHPSASCYGLSIIYQRTDNPFYNIDSAYSKITKSFSSFSFISAKKKEKYVKLGVGMNEILNQRTLISNDLFAIAQTQGTIPAYNEFILKNPWSHFIEKAEFLRDSIAFQYVSTNKTAADYAQFMQTYPNSGFFKSAEAGYHKQIYIETTSDNTLASYMNFVNNYPESPYRDDAEDVIYNMATESGTVDSYRLFIESYPDNRNVAEAWRKLYNTYIAIDYSSPQINSFKGEYADYPFMDEVQAELELIESNLLPVKVGEKWGYVAENKKHQVSPIFSSADYFKEGLAVVKIDGKFGFVNKKGVLQIPAIFEDAIAFNEGHALVVLNDLWGMINRNGEFIIPAAYNDLGELHEGLCFYEENGKYGYFDAKGVVRLKPLYSDAFDFKLGKAVVALNDFYGVIDGFGTTLIPFYYEGLRPVNDSIYIAEGNDYFGIISAFADTILPFQYDYIGLPQEDMFIVEKDDAFNYIDLNGKLILTEWIETYPEYRQLAVFKNGFAKIEMEKGYNLLAKNGTYLFPKPKEDLGNYDAYIAVRKNDLWGYFSPKGAQLTGYNYSIASSFSGKFGFAGKAPLIGMIDRDGNYIIEPYFENLSFLNDSLLIGETRGLFGILTIEGDTLLPFNYVSIEPISQNVVELERDNNLYYYILNANKIIGRKE